ncbi:MAG: outer membrane protein assembly factor BamA [Wenzhouxiangellaceae bacterium]
MRKIVFLILLMANAAFAQPSGNNDNFTISAIRVEGLQRIAEGTVFTYLPLEVGDRANSSTVRSAIRALYRTGFFADVAMAREDQILVIQVQERPAISNISFSGNKAIKTEDLQGALLSIGLSEGEVYDPLQLDRVKQELVRQYYNRGKYSVDVETQVTELQRNRVRISINVDEGKTAKIKHINIVGNTVFDDDELTDDFELSTGNLLSFWRSDDQYSQEKLSGDLEKLRSYYLDRGYVDFNIESTQVSISPDKKEIFITANVNEGDVYTLNEVNLTGDLILDESTLRRLILTEPGDIFSRKEMERSIENITAVLANVGFAFANVNPQPRINRDDRTVDLTFFVEPGKRVYVRRILFSGNTTTKDEVLRREMRQLEGAWFSQAAVDRSQQRLQRLGYFDNVNIETPQVPGSDDQVDVIVSVDERPSGSVSFGLGFSQVQGLITSISVNQDNFLGSGKQIGLTLSRSDILTQFNLSYNNPYWTDDGISRGFFLRYTEFQTNDANISSFTTSEVGAGMNFGIPLSEYGFLRFGAAARRTDINIGQFQVEAEDDMGVCNDINMNGICNEVVLVPTRPLGVSLDENGDGVLSNSEREIDTFEINSSWSRDSRDHFFVPTRGSITQLGAEVSLPGSSRQYYKFFLNYAKYWSVFDPLVFSLRGEVGYGDAYDDFDDELQAQPVEPIRLSGDCRVSDIVTLDTGLPFWEHFFGGGVSDVRGFDDNTLGPKDQFCRSVGGDFKVTGGMDLFMPLNFGSSTGSRLSWFLDIGNVFQDIDAYETTELRASTGISLTWDAPVGPITISYAFPIREKEGDTTEALQFTFGTTF